MIISASYRTDIPAFYGPWFERRLAAGFVRVRNPYGGPTATVSLTPEAVAGYVFWTRNARPFAAALNRIAATRTPFFVHYTITGYPRCLDAATLDTTSAIANVRELADQFGVRTVVWRYDPIIFTSVSPPAWHASNFDRLSSLVAPLVDEVIVSVAQIYRKSARNLGKAAAHHGFDWYDPEPGEKQALLRVLAGIATDRGLRFSLCGQANLAGNDIDESTCIDVNRLAAIAGHPIATHNKSHRHGCRCHASRDIGAYDTCPHGCVYCYAVSSRQRAKQAFIAHDPYSDILAPSTQPRRKA